MDFQAVCRACLTSKNDLYNILFNATSDMYMFCTSIQVLENDVFPKSLCQFCYELLNKLYNFKQQCLQSEARLKLYYVDPNHDTKHLASTELEESVVKIEISEFPDSNSKIPRDHVEYSCEKIENCDDTESTGDDKAQIIKQNKNTDEEIDDRECSPIRMKAYKSKRKKKKKQKKNSEFRVKRKTNALGESKNILDYPCLQCNKKFAYPERLESHKLTHRGAEGEIICNICNKKFKQWDGLRRHREFVHMTLGKTLECSTCGKLYKTSTTLKNHQKIHQERKDYVCHICGGSYRSSSGLQNHVGTHQEHREKSYECKICNKKFVSNSYLTSHMFRHKERRFICQVCRFPFFTRADLTRHMLIHNGIKPFLCEICNKAYSTKSFLVEHGRIHSGERPFTCDYCSMNFISKRRLIDHQRTHTGEKPHKCDKCNQAFIQRGSLTRHLRVHAK